MNKNRIFLGFVIFAMAFVNYSSRVEAATFKGRITDAAGKGMPGVKVIIERYPAGPEVWEGTGPMKDLRTIFNGWFNVNPNKTTTVKTGVEGRWSVSVENLKYDYVIRANMEGFTFGESGDHFRSDEIKKNRFWSISVRPQMDNFLFDYIDFVAFALDRDAREIPSPDETPPINIEGRIVEPTFPVYTVREQKSATLEGSVVDIFNRGIRNVKIQVQTCDDPDCKVVTTPDYFFKTDGNGFYKGKGIKPGRYSVNYFDVPSGFRMTAQDRLVSFDSGENKKLNFTVKGGLGSISGTVREVSGRNILRYLGASLYDKNNAQIKVSELDSSGGFSFADIPYGIYYVRIKPGKGNPRYVSEPNEHRVRCDGVKRNVNFLIK